MRIGFIKAIKLLLLPNLYKLSFVCMISEAMGNRRQCLGPSKMGGLKGDQTSTNLRPHTFTTSV